MRVGLAAGLGLGALGHLPGGEAHLDAELGALQRRLVLPVPGGVLRLIDRVGRPGAGLFPLVVIGMNSIAAYCMAHLFESFIAQSLKIHFGGLFALVPPPYETLAYGGAVLLILWLILYWMYKRKIFLRI